MELKDQNKSTSDDEEDLELLRLEALKSLKKPADTNTGMQVKLNKTPQNLNKRSRGFQGRSVRNGQFNNRPRNTNLISIPTVESESFDTNSSAPSKKLKFGDNVTVAKLVLPQDRYCNTKTNEEKPTEPISKFNRYDNSDKSESESEYESESESENESSQPKLEKASSLEALIQELENEIQRDSQEIQVTNTKKVKRKGKKRKRKSFPESDSTLNENTDVTDFALDVSTTSVDIIEEKTEEKKEDSCSGKVENILDNNLESKLNNEKQDKEKCRPSRSHFHKNTKVQLLPKRKSPPPDRYNKKYYYFHDNPLPEPTFPQQNLFPSVYPPTISFNNPPVHFHPFVPYNSQLPVGNQLPISDIHHGFVPNFSERSLSPLSLNTDDALTIAKAPLSPRSAAFVLKNREIIESRKKSPRRSYSRSPSPRYRRSKSPRSYIRSPSPVYSRFLNRQRFSPNHEIATAEKEPSPVREKRLSPNRKKYISPTRERKFSPYRDKRLSPTHDKKLSPIRDKKMSPIRDNKSSPNRDRRSPAREKRLSPFMDKRSSPNKDHFSPNRHVSDRKSPDLNKISSKESSPKQNFQISSKGSIRDRLGNKTSINQIILNKNSPRNQQQVDSKIRKRSKSISLSPSPERIPKESKTEELDPVLEARRLKFESNEIKNTEGIIRLKPKPEPMLKPTKDTTEKEEENILNEEELLEGEGDILNTKVGDIFSDEETDEENEGRFKSNAQLSKRNVSVLPFTQLLSNSAENVKTEGLSHRRSENRKRDRRKNNVRDRRTRNISPSPARDKTSKIVSKSDNVKSESSEKKSVKDNKVQIKNRIMYRNEVKREKALVAAPIESKKIEIKIRNPSKYETTSKYDVANEHEMNRVPRKIEVTEKVETEVSDMDEDEPEIIVHNESDTEVTAAKSEGDLRAQLSRKRAERQNKLPVTEDVQSRLLQSALQGAVFKKSKKSKKVKESAPKDVKLPIHLRLGFANDMDTFTETVSHKKKRKNKNRGVLEQV